MKRICILLALLGAFSSFEAAADLPERDPITQKIRTMYQKAEFTLNLNIFESKKLECTQYSALGGYNNRDELIITAINKQTGLWEGKLNYPRLGFAKVDLFKDDQTGLTSGVVHFKENEHKIRSYNIFFRVNESSIIGELVKIPAPGHFLTNAARSIEGKGYVDSYILCRLAEKN